MNLSKSPQPVNIIDEDPQQTIKLSELMTAKWSEPQNLGANVNTSSRELTPCLTADEKVLVFLGTSPTFRLLQSERNNVNEPFGPAREVSSMDWGKIHASGISITSDGLAVLFSMEQPETGEIPLRGAVSFTDEILERLIL